MNSIALRWPPAALSPNARAHYMTKHRATRGYRETARYLGDGQKRLQNPFCAVLPLVATRRRRDLDNVLASLKSALDGLTDAGWWSDDHDIVGFSIKPQIHVPKLEENRIVICACEDDPHDQQYMADMIAAFLIAAECGNARNGASHYLNVSL